MENFNLNDIEQIMTFYLIFNFIIVICFLYIVLSLALNIFFKNKLKENEKNTKNKKIRKKKDIIELFWNEDKKSKFNTILRRTFLIVLIIFTSVYMYNSINFIMENIDTVKKILKIE